MFTKLSVVIYTLTATLIALKLLNEVGWSWWAILSALLIYEGIGFIAGFIAAIKSK